jgi:hypothetical protein
MARVRKTPIKTAPPAEAVVVVDPVVSPPIAPEVVQALAEPIAEPVTEPVTGALRKPKLVRDSFTMPKVEYQRIEALKTRGTTLGRPVKKSELLRAGIKLLDGLSDAALLQALGELPSIKTGRPGKGSR